MYKKVLAALGLLLCISPFAQAASQPMVDVKVNGSYIYMDAKPFVEKGSTYAPVRHVSEALGAQSVNWRPETAQAVIKGNGKEIVLTLNSSTALVNGKKVPLSARAQLINDRTYIPVRFIAETMGAQVSWDQKYQNVEIKKQGITLADYQIDASYNQDELFWLARIIHAESQGEPMAGKIAVGDVILNRVKSNLFPNSIYEVIFDRKHGVQFEPILNGSIYNEPGADSIAAAKTAMRNESSVGECLYFFNPRIASSSWISKNRTFYKTIGGHDFYL